VGWSDPEGSRPHLGALLLGYYTDDGKLTCAGRVGTGMADKVLADLRRRLEPLSRAKPPLNVLPPRSPIGSGQLTTFCATRPMLG
jgi:ATP-dependent DNA ligase